MNGKSERSERRVASFVVGNLQKLNSKVIKLFSPQCRGTRQELFNEMSV